MLCQSVSLPHDLHHTVTHSSHSSSVWLTLPHTHILSLTPSPPGPLTLPSHAISGWITLIQSHTSPAHVTHTELMSSTRYTLSHTISHSHIWSLDVTVPEIVSQAHPTSWCHTQSPTCYCSHLTYSHTQPVGVTQDFTQSHSVTLHLARSHSHTQPLASCTISQ